jgi:hypothetical protein
LACGGKEHRWKATAERERTLGVSSIIAASLRMA